MSTCEHAAAGHTGGPERPAVTAELLDVKDVAALLACSARHVYRLADAGRMPAPVRLGGLVRWSRAAVLAWIGQGCPSVRKAGSR